MAAFTIGFIVPFVYGIFLSFCKFSTVTDWKWVGFKNYTRIFVVNGTVDTTFIHSIWYTALFTVVSVLIINIVSFAIAMALTKGIRGTNLFRTVFFLPNLIGGIVLSYVWLMIFNSILQNYSKTIVSSEWSAFWGLIAVVCWQQIGYMMIIYIAGIQNIPGELIEAAKIDGANRWQLLKSVILPMLMPTITICTFLTLTNGFKLFDQNLALTGGNPGKMSELLALNIYNTMLQLSHLHRIRSLQARRYRTNGKTEKSAGSQCRKTGQARLDNHIIIRCFINTLDFTNLYGVTQFI